MSDLDDFDVELDGFPSGTDGSINVSRDSVEVLASEFIDRVRRGENPQIDDYVMRYPHLAEQIRDLFPMVAALENWKSDREAECLRRQLPDEFHIEQLGDCRIVREIGRGGMGVVFEARQGPLQRRVAVKLLPWRFSMVPQRQERFEIEARTIARLQHPQIVPIYGFGTHEGYAYYVMPFMECLSLSRVIEVLRERPLVMFEAEIAALTGASSPPVSGSPRGLRRDSWKAFARIGVQVAQTLKYAHGEGVIHNDVKPANLLIDRTGRVFVTDFGLAEQLDADSAQPEQLTGTLRYMAPERFSGVSSAASDQYALGITLLELVTQEPAFAVEDRGQLIELITSGQGQRPREIEPSVPVDLESIICRATARLPEERYESCIALATDLIRFINGEPVRTPPPPRRKTGWFRRKP